MKRILFTLLIILLASSSYAEDIYIAQSSAGGDTGADCANAHSASWFNTAGSWANPKQAGKVGPGDTAHLCGTITGTAGSPILNAYVSGNSGTSITIKWETGALLTSPNGQGINLNGHNNIIVDGNSTNPSITNTDTGSAGTYTYQASAVGVWNGGDCTNCEIKNLTVTNMYVKIKASNDNNQDRGAGVALSGGSNISVHDNSFDQMYIGFTDSWANGDSNVSVYNNTIDHVNWGIQFGNNNTNTISNLNIYNNHIKNMDNWDSTLNQYHHDGIFLYQDGNGLNAVSNVYIYNNLFDGNMGVNYTAWIYMNSGLGNVFIYNNVFTGAGADISFGLYGGSDNHLYIVNNYIDGGGGTCIKTSTVNTLVIENNAINNCWTYLYDNGSTSLTVDYNAYNSTGTYNSGSGSAFKWNNPSGATFSQYRSANPTLDVHSITPASLGVNASGVPQTGSALIDVGTNLSNLGINTLDYDKVSTSRPQGCCWDIGAYEYTSGGVQYYSVGGTITGLSGSSVIVNNLGDSLTINANGTFTFNTALANNSSYNVTIGQQPPGQTCVCTSGCSGTINGANVTNVAIVCSNTGIQAITRPDNGYRFKGGIRK